MPTTNCGAETAVNEATISARSSGRPRWAAARMPAAQADQQLDHDGAGHELQRRRQARQDQRRDLGLLDVGAAEIALQQVAEIAQILLPQRQVEAELAPDALDHLGRGVAPRELPHRVGRQQIEQHVGDQRDAEQDEQRLAEPPGEVAAHQSRPRWVGSSASRSASPSRLNGEGQQQDRGAGNEHQPRCGREPGLVLEDDVAPGRRRRPHADAEERQGRLEQDRGGDAERAPDQHGRDQMRQDVGEQDAPGPGADAPGWPR